MDRRTFLAGAGTSLGATLAGCPGAPSGEEPGDNPQNDDSTGRFLEEGETPESDGATEFLATVAEVTDGLSRFKGDGDTWRVGFREAGDTWELRYRGTPHAGDGRFREEIAALATAFASTRPDGVSLEARSLHECTTGTWRVSADTAAAYERGELDRKTFVDTVHERAEVVNNC